MPHIRPSTCCKGRNETKEFREDGATRWVCDKCGWPTAWITRDETKLRTLKE